MQPQNKEHLHTLNTAWYQIDTLDPIEGDEALKHIDQLDGAIGDIDHICRTDTTLLGNEKRKLVSLSLGMQLDRLYAEDGQATVPFGEVWKDVIATQKYYDTRREMFQGVPEHLLSYQWDFEMQGLDVDAFAIHKIAEHAENESTEPEARKKLADTADMRTIGLLWRSSLLMSRMAAKASGLEEFNQRARGKLYELLFISYNRLKQYERQRLGSEFVRSSLAREDSPHNNHVTPKRGFDVVIQHTDGSQRRIQTKNHREDVEYAEPIEKVSPTSFRHIMKNMSQYAEDFRTIVGNSSDPAHKQAIDEAYGRLEFAFDEEAVTRRKARV